MVNQVAAKGKVSLLTPHIHARKANGVPTFFGSVESLVDQWRPALPLYVMRPERIAANARIFLTGFPGRTMYAVKCNTDKMVLQTLARAGLTAFDCASIEEVRAVRKVATKAKIYFMHPVKSREAIREAYHTHGVRAFVLDTHDELLKIVHETGLAADLELFVRIALPKNDTAILDFSSKFGAAPDQAVTLLQQARAVAAKLGVSFHVGTQTTDPTVYARAIGIAARVIRDSGVTVESLDVGGGFPAQYDGAAIRPMQTYFGVIRDAVAAENIGHMDLLCEPGRALVADSASVLIRVEQRRGNRLYLNDGIYGTLNETAKWINLVFATRAHRPDAAFAAGTEKFSLAGPTCDSLDMMDGPYVLPADIGEGDWIEFINIGAYGKETTTGFNGFGKTSNVILVDA